MRKHLLLFVLLITFSSYSSIAQTTPSSGVWYQLQNLKNGKSIANNGAQNSGAVLKTKAEIGQGGQWRFVPQGSGIYRIQNRNSKQYLANFMSTTSGSQIKQTNNPGPGAVWKVRPSKNGATLIINNQSGMSLAIGGMQEQAPVVQIEGVNSKSVWTLIDKTLPKANVWYKIQSKQNNFFIANNGEQNSGAVLKTKSRVAKGGHWKFISQGNNLYRIQNKNSKQYLANFMSTTSGSQIKQTNNPGPGAIWKVKYDGRGFIRIVNNQSGMFLSLGSTTEQSPVVQRKENNPSSKWKLVELSKPNTTFWYQLENTTPRRSIANNGVQNSGAVLKTKATVGKGGHWKFIPQGNGVYRIQNRNSKQYMANFMSTASGSQIKQTNNPGSGALWKIVPLGNQQYYIINNASGMYLTLSNGAENAAVIQKKGKSPQAKWFIYSKGK